MKLNNKFLISISCCGYSKYLEASLFYWSQMKYDGFYLLISTHEKDLETLKIINNYKNTMNILAYIHKDNDYNNKGLLLKNSFNLSKPIDYDYFIFSDADILFYKDSLSSINNRFLQNENYILSSKREDIDEKHTELFFNLYKNEKYDWAWNDLRRKIVSPSPFMGWFLACKKEYLNTIDFYEQHQGYDFIDWKIFGQLNQEKTIIYFDNPPLHLYHGKKGDNWKGIT